ncbi:helix-turn-helix domain-containing protein [Burkholderia glumae]|uniref:helix-turn-helix domain-containing protein n=1 Tax=Burkholderia glumae TaxID=337 RepID=UPI00214F77ED|nr:helix-turn-helix transcriptional regulator [Burkholderia glumae]
MSNPDSIGARIVQSRAGLHLSQAQLAERVGIAPTQLSRYEMDKNKPRPEMLQRLAEALDVEANWLATGEGAVNKVDPDDVPTGSKVISLEVDGQQFVALRRLSKKTGKSMAALLGEALNHIVLNTLAPPSTIPIEESAIAEVVAKILAKQYGIEKQPSEAPKLASKRATRTKKPSSK